MLFTGAVVEPAHLWLKACAPVEHCCPEGDKSCDPTTGYLPADELSRVKYQDCVLAAHWKYQPYTGTRHFIFIRSTARHVVKRFEAFLRIYIKALDFSVNEKSSALFLFRHRYFMIILIFVL